MNRIYHILSACLALAAAMFSTASCDWGKDDDSYLKTIPNAVVTVKCENGKCVLQLNDSLKVSPTNITESPYKDKEVRALCNIDFLSKDGKAFGTIERKVNWIDSVLTKTTVETTKDNDAAYGKDPVEILSSWMTVCEDGYLTVRFRTYWGYNTKKAHVVNLVTGVNPDDPYEVEFRHNANGDSKDIVSDAIVAFRLDQLPQTYGKTVKLKVKYINETGTSTKEFDYATVFYAN